MEDHANPARDPSKPALPDDDGSRRAPEAFRGGTPPELRFGVGTSLADAQREILMATLEHFGGDKRRAARVLGISLKTLYNRLGAYGDTRHVRRRSSLGGVAALKRY